MTFDLWLGFAGIALLTGLTPGPGVLLALNYGIRFGAGSVVASALGNAAGLGVLGLAASLGLGGLFSHGSWMGEALRWVGGAYLIWLGISLWRAPAPRISDRMAGTVPSARRRFAIAFGTAVTNPKALAFIAAMFPLFLRPDQPMSGQFALMTVSFMSLTCLSHLVYAVTAQKMRGWLAQPTVARRLNRLSGGAMIAFGGLMILRR